MVSNTNKVTITIAKAGDDKMENQKIRIIKKNNDFSLEYKPGDIFTVDSTSTLQANPEFRCRWTGRNTSFIRRQRSHAVKSTGIPIIWALWTVSVRWWRQE